MKNVFAFFCLGSVLYIFISLVSYSSLDPSLSSISSLSGSIENLGGPFGAYLSDALFSVIGIGAYLFLLVMSFVAVKQLFFYQPSDNTHKVIKVTSALVLLSSFSALCEFYYSGDYFPQSSSGGLVGALIFTNLSNIFGIVGSLIFIVIFFLVSISLTFSFSWLSIIDALGNGARYLILEVSAQFTRLLKFLLNALKSIDLSKFKSKDEPLVERSVIESKPRELNLPKSTQAGVQTQTKSQEVSKPLPKADTPKSESVATSTVYKPKEKNVNSEMPSTDLLDRVLDDGSSLTKEQLDEVADRLEIKLQEFGVEAKVVSVIPGPVVTRFEIQPAPGTKASKITNIAQDIARSLAVMSVRVVEVIPGKSVVGIEIPNTNRKMVRLTEILSSETFHNSSSPLSMALGHDIAGKPIVVDLAKMPHLLVAGTTGSGKSVGLNAMLLSLLFKSDPEAVRLIMIDPKILELSVYEGIPHLLTPVITDMTDASNGLRWCVAEMDRRYKLMSEMGVRGLTAFNQKVAEANAAGTPLLDPFNEEEEIPLEELPSIVVVVDEFADMIMIVGKKVEHLIARIAQKARAAGIHLILATQRPSVDVITGLIKANVPSRIAFQVSSKIDSRTILDQGGAEQLLGAGDMLYLPAGQGVPERVHGAFVGDDEVHRVVDSWKQKSEPNYLEEITSELQETGPIPGWSDGDNSDSSDENDELYDEAVSFVIESRRASISAVQRKLRIGYNRAARIIEAMEMAGLVSEMGSNGSREVLVPKQQ
ncbi:DNA translocase FtsK 4TM domain-containing protein [Gammaproteobacteria bacterium]|nr:DNA translocase FtsK 4TM domain-containing protein [Gammaproteobacteria bacterium]MDC0901792.1 DNA translocase FtsK 4TM domain-containing protein [Gammaproteobacteria bacterium]